MCTNRRLRGQTRYSGLEAYKIEQEIQTFVENFKKKGSALDRPPSLESCSSSLSGVPSSMYSTDDLTDDSPEKTPYLLPEIVRRYRYCSTTTTSDSEAAEEDIRQLVLAYKQGKLDTDLDTSETDGPDREGDVMGTESCPYSVLDVAEVLQSNYAFLSGGKAKNGAPILTFPDRPSVPDVTEEEYRKVVTYLCSIVSLNERQMGFVVLVDRRQSAWGLVKTLFLRFSAFFPYHIQVVFLLEPHGFFQRAFSDYRSKFKEELEFKVVSISSPEEMFEYVDTSQMTSDFGGSIQFDPKEWTQHRSAVEKFSSNAEKVSIAITAQTKRWDECLVPNDVPGTEKIIRDHAVQGKELLEDLESAETHGKTLLSCIKGDNSGTPLVHFSHVLAIEILLVQLEETRIKFDAFWEKHNKKLQQSSSLRKFEEEFKTFQLSSDKNMEWLEQKMMEVGDTLAQVENLIQEFDQFEEKALKEIEHGEKMRTNGEELIVDDHYAVDSIRPKCIELQRICDQYKQLVRRRREILTKSHDLQERIDKANKWCTYGVDMLANQQLERIQTQQGAEKAIQEIDTFLTTTTELKLTNPKEFRQLFDSVMTADSRATVQKVLKRIEDVQGMCAKRRDSLCKNIARHTRPVQPVQPEIVATSRGQTTVPEYDIKKRKEAGGDNSQKTGPTIEKSARLRVDIQHPRPPLPPGRSPRSMMGSSESIDKNGMRNSMASALSNSSSSTTSESTESLHAKRRHVLNELIETETTYVQEMHDILRGYYCEMDNRTMQHLMPEELYNKKEVLFSNLDQIYKFHHDVFLRELQNCEDNPTKVGKCFVNRKDEFQMYCVYCQNKPKSEALRTQVGDSNPFFKECQRRLGHKLPLSAYLLKPIQRITKYQLLLKEMLKYAQEDKSSQAQLEEALNTMLDVLRIVNNSMYHVSIVGYSGNLSDLGKLLLQGSFSVWTEHKKEKIRDIRFKPMQRHVFLYEKAILLCKKKEDSTSEKDLYSYKNMLRLSKVGLTENIKGDKKKFELWLKGREEVYIIQTPSLAVKDLWIREIKKVLMNQFDEIKVSHLNLMQRSTDDEAQQPAYGKDSLESWRYRQGSGNNNTSTVPVGLEMMSPESPQQEHMDEEGWSSGELSNSDDERMGEKKNVSPVEPSYLQQFTVIADYNAVDDVEISIREGDIVEILKTGSTGWWLVSNLMTNEEGWVPANFLEHSPRAESRSYVSMSSMGSGTAADHMTSHSSLTSDYSANSPVDETTV